jgi:hypothetical protein
MYAYGVDVGEEIVYEPVEPLDQLEVAEHVPTRYRVSLSCEFVRVLRNSIKNHNGVLVFPRLDSILTTLGMTGTVIDRISGATLFTIQDVKASNYRLRIGNVGLAMTNTQFVATKIKDESEV